MTAYDEHQAAVSVAKTAIGEVQELLSAVTDKLENRVIEAVMNATGGENCNMESGRIAFQWTSGLRDSIDEIYRVTDNIIAELNRYGDGF